jgi:hypothetical protein
MRQGLEEKAEAGNAETQRAQRRIPKKWIWELWLEKVLAEKDCTEARMSRSHTQKRRVGHPPRTERLTGPFEAQGKHKARRLHGEKTKSRLSEG